MKPKHILFSLLMLIILIISGQVVARNIVINNQRMNDEQIRYLDQLSCNVIPDGNYWLNTMTGKWGYAGGGAQGFISDNCYKQKSSLSERGLLYSPGELLR